VEISRSGSNYTIDFSFDLDTGNSVAGSFTGPIDLSIEAEPPDLNAPGEVTSLVATPSDGEIALSWNDPSDSDLDDVEITWEPDGAAAQSVAPGTGSYTATGLSNGTAYTFTVVTVDATGNVSAGVEVTATPQAPDLTPPGAPQDFSASGISWTMRYVPAKSFPTGTDDSGSATVNADFWLAETEVTYGLWYAVRDWAENGTGGAPGEGDYTFANPGREGDDGTDGAAPTVAAGQEPVTDINWRDAMLWTNALTEWYNDFERASLEPVYYTDSSFTTPIRTVTDSGSISDNPGEEDNPYVNSDADGFRLPGIDEWELAARYIADANSDGDIEDSGEYYPGDYASGADAPWDASSASQDLDGDGDQDTTGDVGWYGDNSGSDTHDVATKDENALGLHDMSGNVFEWNFDWVAGYEGNSRGARGGSWNFYAGYLQVGYDALAFAPDSVNIFYGFRPARNAQ
jgi:formylglycine-generating enzyme required for sulfatase activity